MKTRRSLSILMVAIVAIALGLAALQEIRVWGPARQAREQYIKVHAGLAKNYDRELAGPPPHFPMMEELRQALVQLSAWHHQRAAELWHAGRFDPESERALDRKSSPTPNDDLVREWLFDYHHPTIF